MIAIDDKVKSAAQLHAEGFDKIGKYYIRLADIYKPVDGGYMKIAPREENPNIIKERKQRGYFSL